MRETEPKARVTAVDPIVRRFNSLNASIVALVPAVAVTQATLDQLVPLLRQMQQLLSQRPYGTRRRYRMLDRVHGRIMGATFIERLEGLPSWSVWVGAYASEIGYSVRQLQRKIFKEPKFKYTKECGWSRGDHNRLLAVAALSRELVRAIAAGADTYKVAAELHKHLNCCEELLDKEWEPVTVRLRKQPAHKVTVEGGDLVT